MIAPAPFWVTRFNYVLSDCPLTAGIFKDHSVKPRRLYCLSNYHRKWRFSFPRMICLAIFSRYYTPLPVSAEIKFYFFYLKNHIQLKYHSTFYHHVVLIVKSKFDTTLWVYINRVAFAVLWSNNKKIASLIWDSTVLFVYKCIKIHSTKSCKLSHKICALIWSMLWMAEKKLVNEWGQKLIVLILMYRNRPTF